MSRLIDEEEQPLKVYYISLQILSYLGGDLQHIYMTALNIFVLGEYGIRVNSISPYGVGATPMGVETTGMDEEEFDGVFTAMANLKGVALKAEDVSEAALTMVSDQSRYISGVNLLVDRGYSLRSCA
ncbi:unnamed protein product [Linum trigynum]|uniref:Uncharacterized protein n=1 Tax=Linum trigynum TaxID=586398 RepID=A0AAV2DE69_9ROSI